MRDRGISLFDLSVTVAAGGTALDDDGDEDAGGSGEDTGRPPAMRNLAYVMYTSGSNHAACADGTARIPPHVRLVVIGGEPAAPEAIASWCRRGGERSRLVNIYGATEVTMITSIAELGRKGSAERVLREPGLLPAHHAAEVPVQPHGKGEVR